MCAVAPVVLACVTIFCGVPPTKLLYFHGILRERGVGLRLLGRDTVLTLVLVVSVLVCMARGSNIRTRLVFILYSTVDGRMRVGLSWGMEV